MCVIRPMFVDTATKRRQKRDKKLYINCFKAGAVYLYRYIYIKYYYRLYSIGVVY